MSPIIPKLAKPENTFSEDSSAKINQIKLANCFLHEIINKANVQIIHVDKYNYVRTTPKFTIQEDKTEYLIETNARLEDGGKGTLYLVCLDQDFQDK